MLKDGCLVAAASRVLNISQEHLVNRLKSFDDNSKYSYHIQQIIDIAMESNIKLLKIEQYPARLSKDGITVLPVYDDKYAEVRFQQYLNGRKAILLSYNHAYAWNGYVMTDPRNLAQHTNLSNILEAWILYG